MKTKLDSIHYMRFDLLKGTAKLLCALFLNCLIISCGKEIDVLAENELFNKQWEIISNELVDSCASDLCVGYSICAKSEYVFVAYYDINHMLKIAKRNPDGIWTYCILEEKVDYDNHKSISMIIDKDDIIHLCANMHASPLVYYKGCNPFSIENLNKNPMTSANENHCTYPQFSLENDKLLFHYRDGGSGNGNEIFNQYDYLSKTWQRLLDKPLFDGENRCNAYFEGPLIGPDNKYHIIWCWRDSSDCSTNHGIYYASSSDLITWESVKGVKKDIPITPSDDMFMVDDIKPGEGLINGGFKLGFVKELPVIVYHKYDEADHTNIFIAKTPGEDNNSWSISKITDWNWKWNFSGNGSIIFELHIAQVWGEDNCIKCDIIKDDLESLYTYNFVTQDLTVMPYKEYPEILYEKEVLNGEVVHLISGTINTHDNEKYVIKYETVNVNRDVQTNIVIDKSPLYLYKIVR